ncbi:MAG TPA: RodZ domain-containing protein [Rhizomicrobium sp.]|jgi:cytoskeleton protein RodZ|nr:RodZ domain-containing protein [Rhizomicrobium sp.]
MSKVTRLTGVPADTDLPCDSVGQDLRAARLRRGDELAHISHALRIRKDYLEALESDWPDKLPGRTYALGFVRTYANYVGLDPASLVSRYKLATAGLPESAPQVGPAPEPRGSRFGVGWTLSAIAVAALLGYGVYQLSQAPVSGTATHPSPPAPTEARINAAASGSALRRRGASPPLAAVQTPANAEVNATATGETFGAQNLDARVLLRARALTHVLVLGPDGKVYINRVLHPGDVYRVPNLVGLSLTTPDAGAVSLELDGRDMGAAGKSGHITEALLLDPPAIVDRKRAGAPGEPDRVTP